MFAPIILLDCSRANANNANMEQSDELFERPSKFEAEFATQFNPWINLLRRINTLTKRLGFLLSGHNEGGPLQQTAISFAKLSYETPAIIIRALKGGHFAHAAVLLRWYLEMANLFFCLSGNPTCYRRWLNGKKIPPAEIRGFIEELGYQPLESAYSDWSNIVHGNSVVIENYDNLAVMSAKSIVHTILVGNMLRNTAFMAHRFNWQVLKLLEPHLRDEHQEIIWEYNSIEDAVIRMSEEHNKMENEFMARDGH